MILSFQSKREIMISTRQTEPASQLCVTRNSFPRPLFAYFFSPELRQNKDIGSGGKERPLPHGKGRGRWPENRTERGTFHPEEKMSTVAPMCALKRCRQKRETTCLWKA